MDKPETYYMRQKRLAAAGDETAAAWMAKTKAKVLLWQRKNREKVNEAMKRRHQARGGKTWAEWCAFRAANKLAPEVLKANIKASQRRNRAKLSDMIAKANAGDSSLFDALGAHRQKEKMRRRKQRAKARGDNELRGLQKTHCKRGHEFTPENSYIDSKGNRECRTCRALRRKPSVSSAPAVPVGA